MSSGGHRFGKGEESRARPCHFRVSAMHDVRTRPIDHPPSCPPWRGLATGTLRPYCACPAGRRRARRLSGRCLSGDARGRGRAGLGVGRVHRRDQFGDHRRQSTQAPSAPAAGLLGSDHRAENLAIHARRRHFPQGAQRAQLLGHQRRRPAGLFLAALSQSVDEPHRRDHGDQLLRQRAAARHAAGAGGFLAHQRAAHRAFRSVR